MAGAFKNFNTGQTTGSVGVGSDTVASGTAANEAKTPASFNNPPTLLDAAHAADDFVRRATNRFGIGDRVASYMGGTSLADERAKTEAASARLPPEAGFAADMIGGGPVARVLGGAGLGTGMGSLALQGAGTGVASAVGRGEDPVAGGISGGIGGGVIGALGAAASPVVRWFGGLGGKTPADVTAATKAAQQAAEDAASKYTYPRKDVGFSAGSGTNPQSIVDLMKTRDWLKGIGPNDPGGEAVPAMLREVEQTLSQPPMGGSGPGGPVPSGKSIADKLAVVQQQAKDAEQLQRLGAMSPADARKVASALSQDAPLGSPQATGYGSIASAPESKGPPSWYNYIVKPTMATGGALIGGKLVPGIGHALGGGAGYMLGEAGGEALTRGGTGAMRDAIASQYPGLTGQWTGQGSGLAAQQRTGDLLRSLMTSQAGQSAPSIPLPPMPDAVRSYLPTF